jgi:hypothetical protein
MAKPVVLVAVLIALTCARCDLGEFAGVEDDASFPTVIDEQRGSYGGVTLGASAAAVRSRFGEPGGDSGYFPLDEESYRGPPFIPTPAGRPDVLRYAEAAFLVARDTGLASLVVTRLGATTRAGIAVGDRLARVRQRHDDVRCGEAPAGEAIFGGEDPTYPWCEVGVGRVQVFFGDDPIESITLTLPVAARRQP